MRGRGEGRGVEPKHSAMNQYGLPINRQEAPGIPSIGYLGKVIIGEPGK